ncbi:MAG: hypothetical protein AAFQ37_12195 [Bacteroidota bacterium]
MWIRLLIVLLGIVLMINGCNSLISQNFGTHRLRTLDLQKVLNNGLGDADFVRLENAVLSQEYLIGPALRASDEDYHLHAVLSPQQAQNMAEGQEVEVKMVGWYKIPYAGCVKNGDCQPDANPVIQGLITDPTDRKNPRNEWSAKHVNLAEEVIYLQLWKEPLAWYWNLLMFLGGIGMAIGIEAWWQKRK